MKEFREDFDSWWAKVPEIGKGRRWYDVPYTFTNWLLSSRLGKRAPKAWRRRAVHFINWLLSFEGLERAKALSREDGMYNIIQPPDEEVAVAAIWVCELFPPSYAESLVKRLEKQGWHQGPKYQVPGQNLSVTLRRVRDSPSLGWWPIVEILDEGSAMLGIGGSERAKLPPAFERIKVTLVPLGPSLSGVVASFSMSDFGSKLLNEAIWSPHEPRRYRVGGTVHVDDRLFTGIDNVQRARAELHAEAREWLFTRLPGVFAVEGRGRLPLIELLVRRGVVDGSDRSMGTRNYLRALGLDEITELDAAEWPGVYLTEYRPERFRSGERDVWLLYGAFDEMLDDSESSFNGERSLAGLAYALDEGTRSLLSRLALGSLLTLKQSASSQSRDLARRTYGRRPVGSSKALRRALLRHSLDLTAVAGDIARLCDDQGGYEWGVPEFTVRYSRWVREQHRENDRELRPLAAPLRKELRDSQSRLATELVAFDSDVRGVLATVATINASIGSIRSQRLALLVAVASAVLAAIAVRVAS